MKRMKYLLILFISFTGFSKQPFCSIEGQNYKEKISQMFIVTYKRGSEFKKYMKRERFGGIIGFSYDLTKFKNITSLKNELESLQASTSVPMFMTIDQEGGLVQRLKKYKEMTYVPTAKFIGKFLDQHTLENAKMHAFRIGEIMGSELRYVGFNWNFGPALDLDHNEPKNPISKYQRAYSSIAYRVSEYGSSIIQGMEKYVFATAKHFPGQGLTKIDNHHRSCLNSGTCPSFQMDDLIPFKKAISSNVSTVMIGHMIYPNLDKKLSTFSDKIINQILKSKMNFKGLVVSDDFTMGVLGIAAGVKSKVFRMGTAPGVIGLAASKAIKAGINVLVLSEFGKGRREVYVRNYLCNAIKYDPALRKSIDESYNLIKEYKSKMTKVAPTVLTKKQNASYFKSMLKSLEKKLSRSEIEKLDKKIYRYY